MRKTPIDLSGATRSSGIRRPASISVEREVMSGTKSQISPSKHLALFVISVPSEKVSLAMKLPLQIQHDGVVLHPGADRARAFKASTFGE
jgi:hypothetical protein